MDGANLESQQGNDTQVGAVDKQFLLLRQYHAQGLAQSKVSFWFSLVCAAIGFVVIILAIAFLDRDIQFTGQVRAVTTLFAGTIIDAVSALFFVQSNKARQLMTEFFDKLRSDRKLEEALNLAKNIKDPLLQNKINVLLALSFAEVKVNDEIIASIVKIENNAGNQFMPDAILKAD